MKRLSWILFAALALSSCAIPAPEEGAVSSTTFTEPSWRPVEEAFMQRRSDKKPKIEALEVRLELIALQRCHHGTPITRVDLRNLQPVERNFVLTFKPGGCADIERTVSIAPNGSASVTFPIFPTNDGYASYFIGNDVTIRETTSGTLKAEGRIHQSGHCSFASNHYSHSGEANILMDATLSAEHFARNLATHEVPLTAKPPSGGNAKYAPPPGKGNSNFPCQILRFKREAKDWPTDYRVYSTFDAVVVTPALHAAFPPAVRRALDDFQQLGGAVLVTPDSSESGGLTTPDAQYRFRTAILEAVHILSMDPMTLEESLTGTPMEITKSVGIGILTPLLIIFVFAFVPFVFFTNARRNRRLRTLVVVPAVSIALTFLIGIFSLLFYGTTPTERLQSITFLDQQNHRAITRGQFAVFAPSQVTSDLAFPLDSMFSRRNVSRYNPQNCRVEVGDAYQLAGEWVQPLTTIFFDFQRIAHRSEKLDVKPIGKDGVQVVNLLGAKITTGCLRYANRSYSLGVIEPGEKKTLNPTPAANPLPRGEFMSLLSGDVTMRGRHWPSLVRELVDKRTSPPESTYYAFVGGSPFFPSPFGKRKTSGVNEALVVGTFTEGSK